MLLSLIGNAGEALGYDRYLKADNVKSRTHSLFYKGCMHYEHTSTMPDEGLRPLMQRFG